MNRLFKWLLPVLVVAEVALVRLGILDVSTAIWAVALLEIAIVAVAGRQLLQAYRSYRRGKNSGMDAFGAIEEGFAVFLPRRVARLVTLEPRMYWTFARWVSLPFRHRDVDPHEFTYHRKAPLRVFVWVVILTSPIELGLLELLIPSYLGWLKILLLVLGIYSIFWVIGFYASMSLYPHAAAEDAIELNYGLLFHAKLPYTCISAVEQRKGKSPGIGAGLKVDKERRQAYLSVGTPTNLHVTFDTPRRLDTLLKTTDEVEGIAFSADEPAAFLKDIQERLV